MASGAGTEIARHIHSDEATGKRVGPGCGLPTSGSLFLPSTPRFSQMFSTQVSCSAHPISQPPGLSRRLEWRLLRSAGLLGLPSATCVPN